MNKYKLAIIGATGTALKRTIPALADSTVCEIVGIQGRNVGKIAEIAQNFGIRFQTVSVQELLGKTNPDAVYIATPPFLHLESIQESILHKVGIICEKPLAQNLAEALKIQELLTGKPDIPFMLAHHLRHQAAVDRIKEMISIKTIGDVISVYAQWGFKLKVEDRNAKWKLNPELGGLGTLGEQGIHLVDLFLYLFGKPLGVSGHSFTKSLGTIYDNETMVFHYSDKTLVANCSQTMAYPGNHLMIYGTQGNIEASGGIGVQNIHKVVITNREGSKNELEFSASENFYKTEVENFFSYYFDKNPNANKGTTLNEAIEALRLIEEARKR